VVFETMNAQTPECLAQTQFDLAFAKNGDSEAMNRIVRRYAPRLSNYVRFRCGRSVEDPDGVAQEVWLRFYCALERFEYRRPGAFWYYLKAIARNYVAKQARKARPANLETVLEPAARVRAPIDRLVSCEEIVRFERSLGTLRERERRALLLRLEEMPYAAVARECGYTTEDAARVAVDRSLKKLQTQLSRG
jgi:RNA polymerase sigma factor (sigma-70 family)